MTFDYLAPIDKELTDYLSDLNKQTLGRNIISYTDKREVPELENVQFALVCIGDWRGSKNSDTSFGDRSFATLREELYSLYPGNWSGRIADLGNILPGNTLTDTYFAVQSVVSSLIKASVIPILIGGGQDLCYAQYRAYDNLDQMVNLANIDSEFDIKDVSQAIPGHSFVNRIVTEKPYNLFNYSSIGFQTYFSPQEEIDLMDQLFFDAYRLGEVSNDITLVEPILRDADLVSIDLNAINAGYLSYNDSVTPNGFDGKEICAIARYAGISDKVTSFGIFEYLNSQSSRLTEKLIAQIIWYFIEGVNYRTNELIVRNKAGVLKYNVPVDDQILTFYQSSKTKRWWIEIPIIDGRNNKLKRHTLLPCNYTDYENACNQQMPERWYRARRKNEV